jgi:hypothetical protein
MQSDDLDRIFARSLEIPDDGFTQRVMQQLPPPSPMIVFSRAQVILWSLTAAVVALLAVVAMNGFEFTSWFAGGSLAIIVVSACLVLVHLDGDSAALLKE